MIWAIFACLYLWAAATVFLLFERLNSDRVNGLVEGAVWVSLAWPYLLLHILIFGAVNNTKRYVMDNLILDWILNQPTWVALVIFPSFLTLCGAVLGWIARSVLLAP